MKKIFFIFLIFILSQKIYSKNIEQIPFFISPNQWEVVNPKRYPPLIAISFIKKEISTCRPSLNLAIEKTSLSLDEYTNVAKKTHNKDPNTKYRILDTIQLSQGMANICQICKKTNGVDFELLQMIFVYSDQVYVLTGTCKKEEMLKNYKIFMDAFTTFKIIDDLFSLISDNEKKAGLINEFNKLSSSLKTQNEKENNKNLELFEKYLDKKFANLGKYFQILLIKQLYKSEGPLK